MFVNYGKQAVSWLLGSPISNMYISAVGIGSGSGIASATDVTLFSEVKRNMITGSPDFSTAQKVTFTADFNSVQMSGIAFSEFGLFASGPISVGSLWQHEAFGSQIFDGTNELQIQSTLEVW